MDYKLSELIDADTLRGRVAELAADLTRDYASRPHELVVVGVLKGCYVFLADLLRATRLDPIVDFLRVSSYGASTETSGVVEIKKDVETPLAARDVLIVEDIVDTGLTLEFLKRHLAAQQPASLRVCVLLDKPSRRKVEVSVDYTGFEIPDHFVVGYGLDYGDHFRQLPAICMYEPVNP